jgi:putative sigma-54 modulation protein
VQVAIAARHGELKPEVQDYITRKSEKLLTYFDRVTAIAVTVDLSEERVGVEILVDAEHKHNFVSHAFGTEAGGAFDQALQKMEQQIRKYKEKVQDHRRDQPLNKLVENEIETEEGQEGA